VIIDDDPDDKHPWRGYKSMLIGLAIGGVIGLVVALFGVF
jgi:hypothetical protein